MGVLNVTPDSFSDGGHFFDPQNAIAQARRMAADGADLLDIGAESTRPYGGAVAVSEEEEKRRLAPVLPAVLDLGLPVSIDTMKASVAAWALDLGAAIANDVWGLQRDPDMARVVAERGVSVIVMHNREAADPKIDIMADIEAFFTRSLEIAARAGIAREKIVLDPGIGFGKTPEQSITAIAHMAELKSFGLPLLLGASRKRFIDSVSPAPPDRRIGGSIAAHLCAADARRRHHPRPRRGRDRAGTEGRRRHPGRKMTDRVFVTGLALHAFHGVMEHEATVGQTFKLDLALDIDLAPASRSDKLADTVGYDQVVDVASKAFCAKRHRLVEAAAGAVADAILAAFAQRHGGAGDCAQTACTDRRHLRRRGRDDRSYARRSRSCLRR